MPTPPSRRDSQSSLQSNTSNYRARYSTLSIDLPPPPPPHALSPRRPSSRSNTSKSSTASTDVEAVAITATRGRRASASSHHLLSRPGTSLSLLSPQPQPQIQSQPQPHPQPQIQIASSTRDDLSTAPSPSHSSPHDAPPSPLDDDGREDQDHTAQPYPRSTDPISPRVNRFSSRSSTSTNSRSQLALALASLPWAEPPPRSTASSPAPSQLLNIPFSSPFTPIDESQRPSGGGGVGIGVGRARSPSLSFLRDDPASGTTGQYSHSRSQSRASSFSSSRSNRTTDLPPPPPGRSIASLPGSPFSVQTGMSVHTPLPESQWLSPPIRPHGVTAGERPISGYSGMADIYPAHAQEGSDDSMVASLSAALHRLSRLSIRSEISTKSSTSRKSGKVSRTGSANGSGSRKAGGGGRAGGSGGGGGGGGGGGYASRSRSIRSTRSKRASGSTIHHRWGGKRFSIDKEAIPLVRTDSDNAEGEGEGSGTATGGARQREEMMDLLTLVGRAAVLERLLGAGKRISNSTIRNPARVSISSLHRRLTHSRATSRPSQPSRQSSSRFSGISIRIGTPRTSRSLRQRLSRRVSRNKSREDLFTELDEGSRERLGGEMDADVDVPEDVGGVIVFKEKRASLPPPVPEKPRRLGKCRDVTYVDPLDPVDRVDYGELEKGYEKDRRNFGENGERGAERLGEGGDGGWVEQSPHLGHRSPGWKTRQSVMSQLSTGVWSVRAKRRWVRSVGIGAGVLVIVIVGLLAGLLSRR